MAEFINTVDIIGDDALTDSIIDKSITEYKDDVITKVGENAFSNCTALTSVDLPNITSVGSSVFFSCSKLTSVILRSNTIVALGNTNAFNNTPIKNGTGYIYVPRALVDGYKTASKWSTYANQFRALEDYTVDGTINGELDENKVNPWGAVANAIANGTYKDVYKIGDTVPLHLGTYGEVDMEIVAFDADDKADGSGKAPITWISKDLITRHKFNSTDTNVGGWLGSELRSWMRSDLYNSIPEAVRNSIVEVNKTYADFVSTNTTETKTCVDNVWIPSDLEVTGIVSNFETTGCNYATHFNNVGLAKYIEEIYSEAWWLRSSAEKNNVWMRSVTKQGGIDYAHPTGDFGIALGFCT